MCVRRLGGRVERLCVQSHAERIAPAPAPTPDATACAVDAVYAAARKRVIVIRRGKWRTREREVHFFTCEEGRARREALAGERPVTLATHPTTHDE